VARVSGLPKWRADGDTTRQGRARHLLREARRVGRQSDAHARARRELRAARACSAASARQTSRDSTHKRGAVRPIPWDCDQLLW